jgi:hypothetical protein
VKWAVLWAREETECSVTSPTKNVLNTCYRAPYKGCQMEAYATSTHRRTHSPKIRPRMMHRTFLGECTRPHIAITPLACHSSDRRSFDAEQKDRHQTHRRSQSARMPNIPRARASTLSTHPHSRSRGECSAMCGGSIRIVSLCCAVALSSITLSELVVYR